MDVYIARQPIFSKDKTTSAFELLYRDSETNLCRSDIDGNLSTRAVITQALFTFDLEKLTQNKPAFVNFTRDLILQRVPMLLAPQSFTIEILEDVELDAPVIERLIELKEKGFTLALDDYTGTGIPADAIPLIDIIKVDFLQVSKDNRRKIAQTFIPMGKKMLAEKVETQQDYEEAGKAGYELFQGYYFSRPLVLKNKRKDIASTSYFKLMRELSDEEMDYKKLSSIIYTDAHLTYHLLKKMRKLQYYRSHTNHSVHSALVRMGENEVRRWITLLLMRQMAGDGMDELVRTGLIRAVFCENLAKSLLGGFGEAAFGIGMFTIISKNSKDFLEILENLQLSDDLKDAMNGNSQLSDILTLAQLYEVGKWEELKALTDEKFPGCDPKMLSSFYLAAVSYADNVFLSD